MHSPADAYRKAAVTSQSPREQEAYLFLKAARQINDILDIWDDYQDEDQRKNELDMALDYYRKLWTFIAASATEKENPLPDTIKQNIGNLMVYCVSRAMKCQFQPDKHLLRQLVFINKQIAAGLRGSAKDEETQQATA